MKKPTDALQAARLRIFCHRFLISFLWMSLAALAQPVQAQVLFSPETADEQGFGYVKVIGQDDNGYFILLSNLSHNIEADRVGFKSRKYRLAFYDFQLRKRWSKSIDPLVDKGSIEAIVFFDSKAMVVNSQFLQASKELTYDIYFIDSEGVRSQTYHHVASFKPISGDYSKTKVVISMNRSLFALVVREFTTEDTQSWFASVMDAGMKTISMKTGFLDYPVRNSEMTAFALSDEGHFAMVGYHAEKIKTLSSRRKVTYYLYTAPLADTVFKEYTILGDKSITGIGMAMDNLNRNLVIAGFYTGGENLADGGTFYGTLGLDTLSDMYLVPRRLGDQPNLNLRGERILDGGTGFTGYPIERMILRSDGGAVLVAEAAYTSELSYYDAFTQSFTSRIEYHFENVVVISISPSGVADWNAVVRKEQISYDDDGVFSSFCSMLMEDKLIMLFNENVNGKGSIIRATVDGTGQLNGPGALPKSDSILLLPRSGKQVAVDELLIPAYRKRDLYLVRFTLTY